MKILILGGTGYLGSKIVILLRGQHINYEVYCIKRGIFKSYIGGLGEVYIPSNISEIEKLIKKINFNVILNLACTYDNGLISYDSIIESNITFPLNILNIAIKNGIKRFVTIGTSLPSEFNMYSLTKKKFYDFGKFYNQKHSVDFCNLELEMFYGEDEPENRFFSKCIRKMIFNEELKLTDGTQHRDIIYIDDVCNAILLILKEDFRGCNNIPIGTGVSPSIKEVLEYAHSFINSKSILEFGAIPMRLGEPDCIADISKLKEMNFMCQYTWKEGIARMINKIRESNKFEGME